MADPDEKTDKPSTAKEVVEAIRAAQTPDEVRALAADDERKTVVKAASERLAALEEAREPAVGEPEPEVAEEPVPAPEEPAAAEEEPAEAEAEAAEKPAAPSRRERRRARREAEPEPERDLGAVRVRARARFNRTAPRKVRLVANQVRGRYVEEAKALLQFSPRAAARDVEKLLDSAIANAENQHDLIADELRIAEITVDEGPTLRRFRPRALGRATPIDKRTSHLSIALVPTEE